MEWSELSKILLDFYSHKGIQKHFDKDEEYLSKAFSEIELIWINNYDKIDSIKLVMLSEAPLWGKIKKYVYNPKINNSQFFYRSDLEFALNKCIKDKQDFIDKLNSIGFMILDISPFPLNENDTIINYKQMPCSDYRILLKNTLPLYFAEKLDLINIKKSENIQLFYRYGRVRESFNDLISQTIIDKGLIKSTNEIGDISQIGGGINRQKLYEIINK